MASPWKNIAPQNCGADKFAREAEYPLPGWFLIELRQMASLLSSGERISDDDRRDMAQRMQAVTDSWSWLTK